MPSGSRIDIETVTGSLSLVAMMLPGRHRASGAKHTSRTDFRSF